MMMYDIYQKGFFDVDKLLSFFLTEGQLSKSIVIAMILKTINILGTINTKQRWNQIYYKDNGLAG